MGLVGQWGQVGEFWGVGVGWDYVKFHPGYNKMQLTTLCSGIDSESGRRSSERTSRTNHTFASIYLSFLSVRGTFGFCKS